MGYPALVFWCDAVDVAFLEAEAILEVVGTLEAVGIFCCDVEVDLVAQFGW